MVLHSACRYGTRLSSLPIIRTPLNGNSTTDYLLCSALLYSVRLQPTIRSALLVDIAIGYPLNRQFALLCMGTLQPTIRPSDYPLCSVWRNYNQLSALLCIATLQPTIRSTDYPLCCALSGRTRTDYPLCSALYGNSATHFRSALPVDIAIDYPLYQQSTRLYLLILQSAIRPTDNPLRSACRYWTRLSPLPTTPSPLLCIATLQPTIRSALYGDTTTDYTT
jgi:hypothetical protein